jgi:hypothetical protein
MQKRAKAFLQEMEKIEQQKSLELEKERQKRLEEQNRPINKFIKALRYYQANPTILDDFDKTTSKEEKIRVLREFQELAYKRALPLSKEQILGGIAWLTAKTQENGENHQKLSLTEKIIQKLKVKPK